jgi:hypothetical protein
MVYIYRPITFLFFYFKHFHFIIHIHMVIHQERLLNFLT